MDISLWQVALAGILTVAGSFFAARATGRSSVRVAEVSVEEGAYVRAEGIYKGAISRLEKELDDLRKELQTEREQRRSLERTVGQLKGRLASNGIDVSALPPS